MNTLQYENEITELSVPDDMENKSISTDSDQQICQMLTMFSYTIPLSMKNTNTKTSNSKSNRVQTKMLMLNGQTVLMKSSYMKK